MILQQRWLQGRLLAGFLPHIALLVEIIFGECDGCLERVADLPAVPSVAVSLVAFCEGFDLFVADEDSATRFLESAQIHVPDSERAFLCKVGVIETYVDA